MGLADGDLYVSGSILSFQQMKRIYQNFRAATVPSNLQAGALWSGSDDDRLWHQGASELLEVFTEKTTLTFENLLTNSGFGVWSQSDASKGLATITYDTGAKGAGAAPSVGDAVVGGTSGATAKVISYTTATGTWAAGDAAGIVTVGAVSHDFAFVDNETITFGGVETAVVNMPDSAVQVGLLQNGGFAAATTGWTGTNCTLASIAGGQIGNCLELTLTAGALQFAYQNFATAFTIGKIYKASVYIKSGTSGNEAFALGMGGTAGGGAPLQGRKEGTSTAAWVLHTLTFEAISAYMSIYIEKTSATAGTMLFDEITLYEITPCCTAADALAMDGWAKDATLDLYRQHNDGGTLTQDGSFYSLKCIPSAGADWFEWQYDLRNNAEFYQQFAGRPITFGAWIKTSTASHCRLMIYDGALTYSSYHTGGGAWEWIEITEIISASLTTLELGFYFAGGNVDGSTIVYVSQPMLVFGSHIGEGNYQPKQREWVYTEKSISSNKLSGLTSQSDVVDVALNLEADSDGKLPKGAKAILVRAVVNDAGSAAGDTYLWLGKDVSDRPDFVASTAGLANDMFQRITGKCILDSNGDLEYQIEASGANTFDIALLQYIGVQVN